MKTATVYSSLTMPQRLRAMVSAFGRADHEELDRLADSSPDGSYTLQKVKHDFSGLRHLAALHNGLLLEPCAVWLFGQTFSPEEARKLSERETEAIERSRAQAIEEAASIEAAFTARLSSAGIALSDWQTFRERLLGDSVKIVLQLFMSKVTGHENSAMVAQYQDAIESYLFKDPA